MDTQNPCLRESCAYDGAEWVAYELTAPLVELDPFHLGMTRPEISYRAQCFAEERTASYQEAGLDPAPVSPSDYVDAVVRPLFLERVISRPRLDAWRSGARLGFIATDPRVEQFTSEVHARLLGFERTEKGDGVVVAAHVGCALSDVEAVTPPGAGGQVFEARGSYYLVIAEAEARRISRLLARDMAAMKLAAGAAESDERALLDRAAGGDVEAQDEIIGTDPREWAPFLDDGICRPTDIHRMEGNTLLVEMEADGPFA